MSKSFCLGFLCSLISIWGKSEQFLDSALMISSNFCLGSSAVEGFWKKSQTSIFCCLFDPVTFSGLPYDLIFNYQVNHFFLGIAINIKLLPIQKIKSNQN